LELGSQSDEIRGIMAAVSRPIEDPAAEAAKLLNRLGFAILVIVIPCAGLFSVQPLYSLMPVGAAVILIAAALRGDVGTSRFWRALSTPCGFLVLGLIAWALLSLSWTLFPWPAAERLMKTLGSLLLVAVVATALPDRTKTSNLNLMPIGAALTVLVTLGMILSGTANFEAGADLETSLLQRSVITLVLLIWPALGALILRERFMAAGALVALVAVAAISSWARISLFAMALGALTFTLAMSRPAQTARVAAIVFAILFATAPALAFLGNALSHASGLAQSVAQPLAVWSELLRTEGPRIVTGHGLMMAARGVLMGYLPADIPQSVIFELWYDLGIVGAWTFAALIYFAFAAAGRVQANVAPALLAGLVVILTIAVFGLATEQIWWVSLVGVAAVAFASLVKGAHRGKRLQMQRLHDA